MVVRMEPLGGKSVSNGSVIPHIRTQMLMYEPALTQKEDLGGRGSVTSNDCVMASQTHTHAHVRTSAHTKTNLGG